MRLGCISDAIGTILLFFGIAFLLPAFLAFAEADRASAGCFFASALSVFITGIILKKVGHGSDFASLKKKEALLIVALSWTLASVFSSIPFILSGIPVEDALFEATSGVSTCGASALVDLSKLPKAILLWRSLTQWIGGLGIIVIFIAVLPQFAVAGRQMFFAESSAPSQEKLAPRTQSSAFRIFMVYLLLTVCSIVMLSIAGMPVFDAVCNTFSMVSAGGLSPSQLSIMGYGSSLIVWICIFFMFISGVNFALQYKLFFHGNLRSLLKNSEFRFYCLIIVSVTLSVMAFMSSGKYGNYSICENFRNALFHTVSIMTSTGFYCTDHNIWDPAAKTMLIMLTFAGASAGSAGGGIKLIRVIYALKFLRRELTVILHPKAVIPIKIDGRVVSESAGQQIISFIFFYFTFFAVISASVAMIEKSVLTGIIGAAITLGNTGIGFGPFGPLGGFNGVSPLSKIILSIAMIIGRLELVPFLVMISPGFWRLSRKNKASGNSGPLKEA